MHKKTNIKDVPWESADRIVAWREKSGSTKGQHGWTDHGEETSLWVSNEERLKLVLEVWLLYITNPTPLPRLLSNVLVISPCDFL